MKKSNICCALGLVFSITEISCSQNRGNIIIIPDNIRADVVSIDVSVDFNDKKYRLDPFTREITGDKTKLLISFPESQAGKSEIQFDLKDSTGCTIGYAHQSADVSSQQDETIYTKVTYYPKVSSSSKDLFGVWGSSQADVWAAGAAGTILRWNGKCWIDTSKTGTSFGFSSIAGTSETNVWAASRKDLISHWDGAIWKDEPLSVLPGDTLVLQVLAPDNVWAAGQSGRAGALYQWTGQQWIDRKYEMDQFGMLAKAIIGPLGPPELGNDLLAIAGTSSENLMIAGYPRKLGTINVAGLFFHQLKGDWYWAPIADSVARAFDPVDPTKGYGYSAAWTAGPSDYWFGVGKGNQTGEGAVLVHWDGASFSKKALSLIPSEVVDHVWGSKIDATHYDMWVNVYDTASKASKLYRNKGTAQFIEVVDSAYAGRGINAIWGSAANDVWLVGQGGLRVHWDGQSFQSFP